MPHTTARDALHGQGGPQSRAASKKRVALEGILSRLGVGVRLGLIEMGLPVGGGHMLASPNANGVTTASCSAAARLVGKDCTRRAQTLSRRVSPLTL